MRHLLRLSLAALLVVTAVSCDPPPPAGQPDSGVVEEADTGVPAADAAEEEADGGPGVRPDASTTPPADGSVVAGDDAGPVEGLDASQQTPDTGAACSDECAPGSQVCDGQTGYRTCGQFDADPCFELSATVACAAGDTCVGDSCVAPCRDECAVGSTFCKDRATLQVCGNFDQDACREPGGDSACGAGKKCEAGACVADTAACTHECTAGSASCSGDAVRTCGEYDNDTCRDLSAPVACASGQTCKAGACVAACSDECPLAGAKDCLGDAVRTCADANSDGCLEWGVPAPCASGQSCSAGACATSCVNECQTAGGFVCTSDESGLLQCGQYDSDSCLDLSSAIPCADNKICRNGTCTASCSDDCQLGAKRCGGDAKSLESCGDFDADPCLEFGGAVACPGGAACANGACATPCSDECSPSAFVECIAGQAATHVCGQYDADPCLDWSSATACQAWQTCEVDTCVLGATPGKVVINEVVYDPVGTDADPGNNLFVELWGPPGLDLEGFALVGVNGADGKDYATIALDGQTVGSDGYFLVAHPSGAATLLALADLTSAKVDFQNGPDSIQLQWHGRVVDALAYGTFSASNFPKGEGTPATAPPANSGKSLTRNASHADTDVNSADFAIALASPRLSAVACTDACAAGATQCGGTNNEQLQTCGDANGDGCREWGTPTSCGTGKFCQAGQCVSSCTNLCATAGATQCGGLNNQQIQTCGDQNGDGCREWSSAVDCGLGKVCQNGSCVASCSDACTAGAKKCGGALNAQLQTCADHNSDGCLEWGTAADCPSGQTCQNGGCVIACTSTCTTAGATRCSGSQVQTCTDTNLDGCLEWSAPANCPGTDLCQGSACSCTDECAAAGNTKCDANGLVMTCITSGACLKWSGAEACPGGGSCKFGACCIDDCTVGQTQCSGQQVQTCGSYDDDGCRDWSIPANCATAGEICQGGRCQVPCTNACPAAGATSCTGTQVRTCGDANGDGCLEWSAAANCPTGQSCVMDLCQDAGAPEVVLISPQGTVQSTQGKQHRIVVDATAKSGRSIASVGYYASGALQHTTTAPPHEYLYTVPASAATGSTIALQAKATDSAGSVGSSAFAYLAVRNDFPVATFVASVVNVGIASVDASACTDTETATADLEVCWSWDGDTTCETTWSKTKTATSPNLGSGTKVIRMKVRDAVGQVSEATRTVEFQDIQFIGGVDVNTTTWYGTIVVTGDINVPAGQVLTVNPGTQVVFVKADTNNDGVGDYTLTINGQLVVNGTAANPVVFTGQDASAKVRGGWDRILIQGSTASSISHAVIEYADVGLDIRNGSSVSNTVIRSTRGDCIYLYNADNASFTDVTATLCGGNGLTAVGGSTGVTATRLTSTSNGGQGMSLGGSSSVSTTASKLASNTGHGASAALACTLNLSDSTVELNGGAGLAFLSTGGGLVKHNQIRQNAYEGVRLLSDASGDPSPVINENNLYSNATAGAGKLTSANTSSTLSASLGGYGSQTSSVWTAPAGTQIHRVRVNYSESTSSSYIYGELRNGTTGAALQTFQTSVSGSWVYVPAGLTKLQVFVTDTYGYSSSKSITADTVEVIATNGATDVSAMTAGGTADLRYNYLGVFPNVLSRVSLSRPNALNLQGFVGELFDTATWSRGPYKAGTLGDESWSGTIYVTGDITVPAGKIVTAAPGTTIHFVNHDQDPADGKGDFTLTANGRFSAQGTVGNEVFISGYNMTTGDGFQSVVLAGSAGDASTWTDVVVQNGRNALVLRGSSSLTRLTLTGGSGKGVSLVGATGAALTDVSVTGAGGNGFDLDNSDNATLTRVTAKSCGGDGLFVGNGSTGVVVSRLTSESNTRVGVSVSGGSTPAVTDSTIRYNGQSGVYIHNSSPDLDYNLISYNTGAGLWTEGSGAPTGDYNIIKFNADTGVSVWERDGSSPTPTFQYSNIYSNATAGSRVSVTNNTSSTLSASLGGYGSQSSTVWTPPAGETMRRAKVTYSESTSSSYIYGELRNGANGAVLQTFQTSVTGTWVAIPAGVPSLTVFVTDTYGYSSSKSISVAQVETSKVDAAKAYDLVAVTDAGTTIAKFNFWTSTFSEVPNKIFQARVNSVDYTGYYGFEYPSGSVTQVGPRP